jgi:hypothetical protein
MSSQRSHTSWSGARARGQEDRSLGCRALLAFALASLAGNALPGSAATPARPTPVKNERRPETPCQRPAPSAAVAGTDAAGIAGEISLGMTDLPDGIGVTTVHVRVVPPGAGAALACHHCVWVALGWGAYVKSLSRWVPPGAGETGSTGGAPTHNAADPGITLRHGCRL